MPGTEAPASIGLLVGFADGSKTLDHGLGRRLGLPLLSWWTLLGAQHPTTEMKTGLIVAGFNP